jgi:alginate O-acetyltransferase complex protein AlgI
MVFSSLLFISLFLPLTLLINYISPNIKVKNIVLLIASLLFYSWGEPDLVLLMIVMIVINYFVGLKIESSKDKRIKLRYLYLGIIINVLSICYFKYTNFFIENINILLNSVDLPAITIKKIRLPIGISFFTFQSLSYLIDVYRKDAKAQRNPLNLGLYISLFPQLIAGPIVRYHDIAKQIIKRETSLSLFYSGAKRFIEGLGKKVIIANTVGYYADQIFILPPEQLSSIVLGWAVLLYSLQIFFDFSGYSDMAIGLGRMFGFKFLENFNYPYIATSIKDFWRRWHISLSTWFRDYLYIPLGGNRKGLKRVYLNLSIVFLVTGLWHGAKWNFIIWGAFHGVLLIIEKLGFEKVLKKSPKAFNHFYVLFFVGLSWIIFRSNDLDHALRFIKSLFSFTHTSPYKITYFLNFEVVFACILGIIFSMPLNISKIGTIKKTYLAIPELIFYLLLIVVSIILLSANTYNPFIYFQF